MSKRLAIVARVDSIGWRVKESTAPAPSGVLTTATEHTHDIRPTLRRRRRRLDPHHVLDRPAVRDETRILALLAATGTGIRHLQECRLGRSCHAPGTATSSQRYRTSLVPEADGLIGHLRWFTDVAAARPTAGGTWSIGGAAPEVLLAVADRLYVEWCPANPGRTLEGRHVIGFIIFLIVIGSVVGFSPGCWCRSGSHERPTDMAARCRRQLHRRVHRLPAVPQPR